MSCLEHSPCPSLPHCPRKYRWSLEDRASASVSGPLVRSLHGPPTLKTRGQNWLCDSSGGRSGFKPRSQLRETSACWGCWQLSMEEPLQGHVRAFSRACTSPPTPPHFLPVTLPRLPCHAEKPALRHLPQPLWPRQMNPRRGTCLLTCRQLH